MSDSRKKYEEIKAIVENLKEMPDADQLAKLIDDYEELEKKETKGECHQKRARNFFRGE